MRGRETRPHIGIFGRTNVGKSSFINAITGQDVSIVSDLAGTTTDPVNKSVELTGIGPVVLVDTAGFDDTSQLGELRANRTRKVLETIDAAILLIANNAISETEQALMDRFQSEAIPFLLVHNKSDLEIWQNACASIPHEVPVFDFSSVSHEDPWPLLRELKRIIPPSAFKRQPLVGDLVAYGDVVMMIVPIDLEAPEGRLILPQVQAIRDILDNDAIAIVLKEREVDVFLKKTGIEPSLVITDSSIFTKADAMIPKDIPLTGFSVMLARFKGDFDAYLEGTPKISELKDGDRILLLESCSHHTSCDDIGRVKIPRWISNFTGRNLHFEIVAGLDDIPGTIQDYSLVVQCGGCMVTRRQLVNRLQPARKAGIPVTNYGMAIAYVQGVYERAVAPFVNQEALEATYL
ncbi:[FeFe] hydrogenase H-cluster maturation GTPase HydF [uncultured Desulfosarcina sp.]|uniref:[FeFe] hydrogenase H-cluster maturation GTPase HydF n=1 Tax=uncultured Desulfosarcina sp. TaxID=218289 RepID=UPI0029C96F0D|nr:[FeFe] hydrogenase H-cluster maturation GTPase HydF [uncultured Desulfosarcina sp.]